LRNSKVIKLQNAHNRAKGTDRGVAQIQIQIQTHMHIHMYVHMYMHVHLYPYMRGIWPGKSQVLQGKEASKAAGNMLTASLCRCGRFLPLSLSLPLSLCLSGQKL